MSMTAKRLAKLGRAVLESIDNHAGIAAGELRGRAASDETPIELEPAFDPMRRLITRSRDAMIAADDVHDRDLLDESTSRAERDRAKERLSRFIAQLRQDLTSTFGHEGPTLFGLDGRKPRDAFSLIQACRKVRDMLRDPELRLPEAEFDVFRFLPIDVATTLDTLVGELDAALRRTDEIGRRAQGSRVEKNRAIEEFRRVLIAASRAVESLYILGGHPELAAYVRPARRRAAQADVGGDGPIVLPDPLDAPTDTVLEFPTDPPAEAGHGA